MYERHRCKPFPLLKSGDTYGSLSSLLLWRDLPFADDLRQSRQLGAYVVQAVHSYREGCVGKPGQVFLIWGPPSAILPHTAVVSGMPARIGTIIFVCCSMSIHQSASAPHVLSSCMLSRFATVFALCRRFSGTLLVGNDLGFC